MPDVLFLCETLVHVKKIEEPRTRLGFDVSFAVDGVGRSGGLALFWKHLFDCHVLHYSSNFIDTEVSKEGDLVWRLTGFYVYLRVAGRCMVSWDILRTLARDNTLPWCTMGYFNDLISNDDKWGSADRALWLLRGFQDAVLDRLAA